MSSYEVLRFSAELWLKVSLRRWRSTLLLYNLRDFVRKYWLQIFKVFSSQSFLFVIRFLSSILNSFHWGITIYFICFMVKIYRPRCSTSRSFHWFGTKLRETNNPRGYSHDKHFSTKVIQFIFFFRKVAFNPIFQQRCFIRGNTSANKHWID